MKITLRQLSLKTLKYATAQQVLDKVAKHLLKQGEQSKEKNDGGLCAYKGVSPFSGKRISCAAGCLMKRDEYKPKFECTDWKGLVRNKLVSSNHQSLIMSLQRIHDTRDPEDWMNDLKELARVNNLSDKAFSKLQSK